MAKKPLEIDLNFGRDNLAKYIGHTWQKYNNERAGIISLWKEQRNYVFATDTTTTSNKSLPWKNSTTIPKLCQIRDNLHANYVSALFPNDDWLKWEAYSLKDATKDKARAVEAYMANKCRESHFRVSTSQLLYDYIDYGNCFATVEYVSEYRQDAVGNRVPGYIGPRIIRISPYDIVFNPLASSFHDSFKIIRAVKTVGELKIMLEEVADNQMLKIALDKRDIMFKHMNSNGVENLDKDEGLQIDGFGNFSTYLQSGFVEVLTFYGDLHIQETGELRKGRKITVIDRMFVVADEEIPSWFGSAPIFHAGWRIRPDNLWAMGPLENLVGMQYRIDHLENLKADAMDLAVLPPLVIKGEVEEFVYGPASEIHIDENGDVTELAKNSQWVIAADTAIDRLEARMEQYAGAPREAMGIRSPGEKTAFEVQKLDNASSRIFQEKIDSFEIQLLEPTLNAMLETARRSMDSIDIVKVIDDDLGVQSFMQLTKEDITATGVIRPIGARHFAAQAQLLQNVTNLSNTPVWQQIIPHMSSKALATLVEDVLGLHRFALIRPNIAVSEQMETQQMVNMASETMQVEQSLPPIQ